jgi:hypothetical protein
MSRPSKPKRSRKKRLVIFACIVGVLTGVGIMTNNNWGKSPTDISLPGETTTSTTVPSVTESTPTITQPTTTPSTSTNPTTTQPTTTTPKPLPGAAGPHSKLAMVAAAALVNNDVTKAQFAPLPEMETTIRAWVYPTKRQAVKQGLLLSGEATAKIQMLYRSKLAAYLQADYKVKTISYWIVGFNTRAATVRLFTDTSWLVPGGTQIQDVYGLTDIVMRWLGGQWLYYAAHDPPANKRPPLLKISPLTGEYPKLNKDEALQRYLPYIGGFHDYASIQTD